jgi:hypothetical protein
MAFHNPNAQDAILEECKTALPKVLPELIGYNKSGKNIGNFGL